MTDQTTNTAGVPACNVDWLGLALDLEAQAKRVESQTAERAMLAAAHGLRLMGNAGVEASDADRDNAVTLDRRDLFDAVRIAIKDAITTDENMDDEAPLWSEAHDRTVKCLEAPYRRALGVRASGEGNQG